MTRPLALLLGLPLFTACDDNPCEGPAGDNLCIGVIAVDLASDPPEITLTGQTAVFPDRLSVVEREGARCSPRRP